MKDNFFHLSVFNEISDLDGNKPRVHMYISNRGAGKTTEMVYQTCRLAEQNNTSVFLYRVRNEISALHMLFSDVIRLYPDLHIVECKTRFAVKEILTECYAIYDDGTEKTLCYGFPINDVDKLKKYSPIFHNVELIFFDEMILERGTYLKNELALLSSAITTIARGGGRQSREIDFYMFGNRVTLLNPYFIAYGIHKRLRDNTKILRGHGWVAMFDLNQSAKKAMQDNKLLQGLPDNEYTAAMSDTFYLFNADAFVEKMSGNSRYIMTVSDGNKLFGIREYYKDGIVYVDSKPDKTFPHIITYNNKNHNANTIMLSRRTMFMAFLQESYDMGLMRFEDLSAKNMILDLLAVRLL